MNLVGRGRELGLLRTALDRREASVLSVSGPKGAGKTALVTEATAGFPSVMHRCPPLPDPSQRASFASTLNAALTALGRAEPTSGMDSSDWPELLASITEAADPDKPPLVVVLDDAHRLTDARSRLGATLRQALATARQVGRSWHLVLVGRPGALPQAPIDEFAPGLDLHLGPLPFRAALPFLPGVDARERLESYGVFGGLPGILALVDPGATLNTNVRRLVLASGGALVEAGTSVLERELQTPSRYSAILMALSGGEAEWGTVHAGVTDLTTSGQVAPYLKRLEEMGLLQTRRSLDSKPRGRNRRYRITDPFLAFWYRLASMTGWRLGEEDLLPARSLREAVHAQAASVFPEVCRQYMEHDVMEVLGSNARECGSLWGAHYDISVAGILTSGAAFYGAAAWADSPTPQDLRVLDRGMRETRYGYGRETRLRMLFLGEPESAELARAAARRHDVILVTVEDLAGAD